MFEKLLSLMPYSPAMSHQMAFYSRRMREEASIRRIGTVFIFLAFLVQFFAVLNPPQPTVAASSNDLINGGISSRAEAVTTCQNNTHHYGDIMEYYGISCADIASAEKVTIKSTGENKQLFSLGRLAYGKQGETPASIKGASYFWRYLWSWDTGAFSTYTALKLHSHVTNKTFWILFSCGNLTTIGVPSKVTPPQPTALPTTPNSHVPVTPTTPPPTTTTPPPPPPKTPVCELDSSLPKNDVRCHPCEYNSSILKDSAECKPCDKSISSADLLACVGFSKTASNITAGIADANGTQAKAGDVITYTIFAKNNGKAAVKNFAFQENLSDVLDYANVTDLHGGSLSNEGVVSWPSETIAANETAKHQITVKVKDPIPQTPTSTSDPGHFDLTMTNVYGNTVNITLPGSPAKTVETTAATLPNTGPGTSLFMAAAFVIVSSYFWARSRLLSDEAMIAVHESTSGGL
jgi:uncharacterized repeat protein (TIGR01451 family)